MRLVWVTPVSVNMLLCKDIVCCINNIHECKLNKHFSFLRNNKKKTPRPVLSLLLLVSGVLLLLLRLCRLSMSPLRLGLCLRRYWMSA